MWNFIKKVVGKVLPIAKKVGSFVARHHQHIAPLAMGLAQMSGNETAQKVAGVGMALSNMATMRQKLNEQNQQAYQARMSANKPNAPYSASTGAVG